MKRIILLQAILLLVVSCDKVEGWFGGGNDYEAPELVIGEITDESAEISLVYQDDYPDAEVGICYATHSSPTVEDNTRSYYGSAIVVEGLSPKTVYHIRSYVVNDDEKTFYGPVQSFTTEEERPKVIIEDFANYEQSVTVGMRIYGAGAVSAGICWGVEPEPSVEDFHKEGTLDSSDGLWRATVDGLEESTHYFLRAYVKSERGEVFYGRDQKTFSTDGIYSPDMGIDRPVRCGDTYADLTYYVNESNIIRRGVCWATHTEPTLEDNKTVDDSVDGKFDIRLEGLTPATLYYVRPYVVLPNAAEEERIYYGIVSDFTTYEADEFFEIPDENFKAYLIRKFDRNGDGKISKREAANVSIMEMSGWSVASLEGIEHFPNLGILYCESNQITELDLSANTSLSVLRCNDNKIIRLELGSSIIEVLECKNNLLTALDVSGLPSLVRLEFDGNKIRNIDLGGNEKLVYLSCGGNPLSELAVSGNPLLEELYCHECKLTSLDLSPNPKLKVLWCFENELAFLNLAGCTALTRLECSNNSLSVLDVSHCTEMETLGCRYNETIELLDLSRCKRLKTLDCDKNRIRGLDLSDNVFLTRVWCDNNRLESLDVSGCILLDDLDCGDNNLASLSVRDLSRLTRLSCSNNSLTYIDLKGAVLLETLVCTNNALGTLDVSDNTYLEYLHCGMNNIASLDLRNNPDLTPENVFCDSYVNIIWH